MRTRVLVLFALAALLAGCGSATVVAPTAVTVVGSLPTAAPVAKGDAVAGKKLFLSSGCGGCHAFKAAATNGKVGPDLDNLAADATKANQGSLAEYVFTSIKNPSAYVVPGYPNGVMPNYGAQLTDTQIADITAFLTQSS
ncbi:MAG: cytochrome c [Gaiellaceae bacterium]|jgi:mono/diheme cytochrome c family protein|nr:cytochrome c [Gaiellaceae bacterium]